MPTDDRLATVLAWVAVSLAGLGGVAIAFVIVTVGVLLLAACFLAWRDVIIPSVWEIIAPLIRYRRD